MHELSVMAVYTYTALLNEDWVYCTYQGYDVADGMR